MLKKSTKIGFGVGDLASNLVFQLTVIFLLFFFTDIMGISPFFAGTILLVARIWDAFNDPMMGLIVDKTKSKHGNARVFLLYGSLPLALSTVLLFTVPPFGLTGRMIYALVVYLIWGMLYTLVNIPYSALTAQLTTDPDERTSLSSIRMIFMLIAVILVSVVAEPLAASFETLKEGYFTVALLFSFGSFAAFLVCFVLTKTPQTTVPHSSSSDYKLREIWSILGSNKPLLILALSSLVGNTAIFMRETAAIYYVDNNLGDSGLLPVFLGVVVISMVIANCIIPAIARKLDKKNTMIYGAIIGIIGSVAFLFVPPTNLPLILVSAAISSMGLSAISTLGWAMIPDTIEYGEYKNGKRAEGISYAVFSFSQKLATAIGGFFVGIVLEVSGYNSELAVQGEKVLQGNLWIIAILPAILTVISIVAIIAYPINRKYHAKMVKELEKRNANS